MRYIKRLIKKALPFRIWDYLPESVFRFYAGKPLLISREIRGIKNKIKNNNFEWDDLIEYSKIAPYDDKCQFYENAIMKYESSIEFDDVKNSEFVGDGRGVGSLNSYRRVSLLYGGESVDSFEKVYKESFISFKKTQWFYEEVYPQIKSELRIPKLIKYHGTNARIVYFEWLDNLQIQNENDIAEAYKKAVHVFSKVRLDDSSLRKSMITNYMEDALFNFSFERSKFWVERNIGEGYVNVLNSLNEYVLSNKKVKWQFVHGNLSSSNMFDDHVILDFDNCGYFPLEYEAASFITSFHRFESVEDYESILNKYNLQKELFTDKLTFLFFTFVFYNREQKDSRRKFLIELWNVIYQKYQYYIT